MKTDAEVIAEVAALDAKAMKGPWRAYANGGVYAEEDSHSEKVAECFNPHRAQFIAASRTLLPDLAARLTAANQEIAEKDREIERLNELLNGAAKSLYHQGTALRIVRDRQGGTASIEDLNKGIAQIDAALSRIATEGKPCSSCGLYPRERNGEMVAFHTDKCPNRP